MSRDDRGTTQPSLQAILQTEAVQEALLNTGLYNAKTNTAYSFQVVWEQESRRVAKIIKERQEGMEITAKKLLVRVQNAEKAASSSKRREEIHAELQDIRRATNMVVSDSIVLQDFLTSSRNALWNIAITADKRLALKLTSLVQELFPKIHLNTALVCVVSDLYHTIKQAEAILKTKANTGDTVWQAPSSFERNTTKYWVKDEDLTELLMACAIEAPLLVYGKKGPLTATATRRDLETSEGDKLWDSLATRITSVYFDSTDMNLYKHRLARAEGAQLLRARWYGSTMPVGEKIIFLELKTHHERWVTQKSVKERASIQERDMVTFLKPTPWNKTHAQEILLRATPTLKDKDLAKATNLLLRMHNLVVNNKLTACVRSVYYRAAFQSAKSNDLRLTLDRTVTLVDERVQRSHPDRWCLSDEEVPSARAKVVPYNVFEVKLAGDDPMPRALQAAVNTSVIQLATKFSKFTTGAAAFNKVATLPYWAAFPAFRSFFGLDSRISSSTNLQQDTATETENDYALMTSPNLTDSTIAPPGVRIAPQKLARVEPKTFFAHERTFVQWISASTLLLSVSGFLLQTGNFDVTAGIIAVSAFGLVVYSTFLYFKRLELLKDRHPDGYFNKASPRLLSTLVALATFLIGIDSLSGGDVLGLFVGETDRDDYRMLGETMAGRRNLIGGYKKYLLEEIGTLQLLTDKPSALIVDSERDSFLMTSNDSVYSLPSSSASDRAQRLVKIPRTQLRGLTFVGGRIFAISGGPDCTELIELAWEEPSTGKRVLRVIGRWKILDSSSRVDGFTFVPPNEPNTFGGAFYIGINSFVHSYSVPVMADTNADVNQATPRRLKSLNMKVLCGISDFHEGGTDTLSSMVFFEGAMYALFPGKTTIQSWNLTDGSILGELEIPMTTDQKQVEWKGLTLERMPTTKDGAINTAAPQIRGVAAKEGLSPGIMLHLLSESCEGIGIWRLPLVDGGVDA